MAHVSSTALRSRTSFSLRSMTTLARWRLQKTWPFLLVIALGLLVAVTLICLVPFLTEVTTTASMRDLLQADARNSALSVDMNVEGLSTPLLQHIRQQLDGIVQQNLKSYLLPSAPSAITVSGYTFVAPAPPRYDYDVSLLAYPLAQAAPRLTILQGRMPRVQEANGAIDVLLTPETANLLHLSVGDTLALSFRYTQHTTSPASAEAGTEQFLTASLKLHLAGLFHTRPDQSLFWQQQNFIPAHPQTTQDSVHFAFLTADSALLSQLNRLALADKSDAVYYPQSSFLLHTLYQIDTNRVTSSQLNDLLSRLGGTQDDLANRYGDIQDASAGIPNVPPTYPYLEKTSVSTPLFASIDGPGILTGYQNRLAVVTVPVLLLTLQIVALVLYFVSLMTDLLVERQTDALAVMRSRGASRVQVFAMLAFQCLILCLLALLLGSFCAFVLTAALAKLVLLPAEGGALDAITSQPLQAFSDILIYAGGTMLVAFLAMSLTLWRAVGLDVLAVRRASSRSSHQPLWQRFYLDVVAGVLAVLAYLISLYLTSLNSFFDPRSRTLIVVPLTLLAPLFLVLGCLLLFLRLFPQLLRLSAWFALRGKGATPMLALAQMARSPAQSLRTTMLLALATAFTIFSLIFTASQNQRATLLADYEAGADFRGAIPADINYYIAPSQVNEAYRTIPGVTAASSGFVALANSSGDSTSTPFVVRAVDADTFAQTALWPSSTSERPLSALLAQLVAGRTQVKKNGVVPVIIDKVLLDRLNLHIGAIFSGDVNALPYGVLRCQVVGIVSHLPTVNDDTEASASDTYASPGAVLLDYQSYAILYRQGIIGTAIKSDLLPLNQVWLRTKDDPASVNSVRTALLHSSLRLEQLYDRRDLAASLHNDPLYLDLLSILFIGAGVALLLALVGCLLSSWLSARSRLTNFAVLRALGTSPRQVANVLRWEQAIIYSCALLLGGLFGMLLSVTIVPALLVSNLPTHGVLSLLSNDEFYALQHILPAQLVFSFALVLALVFLGILCVLVLGMMVRMVSRPSLSQILRINED